MTNPKVMVSRKMRSADDRNRINPGDDTEVRYLAYKFPWFSRDEIVNAIRENGPDRDRVIRYLERKKSKATKAT